MEKRKQIEERMQAPVRVDPLAPQSTHGQQTMNYQQEQKQELHQGIQQHAMELHGQLQRGPKRKTLWIGSLESWMDASYLRSCFAETGHDCTVKIIQSKKASYSKFYGFAEFESNAAAQEILEKFDGQRIMPRTEQPFRMNWSFQESRNLNVDGAKVVKDSSTGRSKTNGSVRFGEETERDLAMTQMNGVYCPRYQQPQAYGVPSAAWWSQHQDPNRWNGQYYVYVQGYEGSEFAQRSHDTTVNAYTHGNYPESGNFYQQQSGSQAGIIPVSITNSVSQDCPGGWGQPQYPNAWNGGNQQGSYGDFGYAQLSHDRGAYTYSSHPGYRNSGQPSEIQAGIPRAHTHRNHPGDENYGQLIESQAGIAPAASITNSAVKQEVFSEEFLQRCREIWR